MEKSRKITYFFTEIVWFLPLILLTGWLFYKNLYTPASDFSNYYFGAYFQAKGQSGGWWYDPVIFNGQIKKAGFHGVFASYSPNPPSIALLFLPFTGFSPTIAKVIFNGLSGVLLTFFLFRWRQIFSIDKKWLLALPILFFRPIDAGFYQGQPYIFLLILLVEGYVFLKKDNYAGMSFCWTIAVFLKIFPVILFLYLATTRQFKAFLWLTIVCLTFLSVSIAIQGLEIWITFFTTILPGASAGEVMDSFAVSFQSWNVFLKYLFVSDELANPHPALGDNKTVYWAALWLIKTLILSVSGRFIAQNKDDYQAFALLILSSLLLSPVGSVYSLILLAILVPTQNNMPESETIKKPGNKYFSIFGQWISWLEIVRAFVIFLICNIPFHSFTNLPLVFRFTRLFLITILWISFIRKDNFSATWFLSFLVLLAPLHLRHIIRPEPADRSIYVPVLQNQPMLTGFSVENQKLVYTYLNEHGENKVVTDFEVSDFDNKAVALQNNQLYYLGKQISTSPDLKKFPVLINKNTVIYLSGKNRGVGFYALRMIKLNQVNYAK